ncbi:hypothetical protein J6590_080328 [Homalodisca vitripennis]|nr:hypothetical protein J6590_080328 [Homalodisca vitripennis]
MHPPKLNGRVRTIRAGFCVVPPPILSPRSTRTFTQETYTGCKRGRLAERIALHKHKDDSVAIGSCNCSLIASALDPDRDPLERHCRKQRLIYGTKVVNGGLGGEPPARPDNVVTEWRNSLPLAQFRGQKEICCSVPFAWFLPEKRPKKKSVGGACRESCINTMVVKSSL